jgi:nucleotide-binding universal stress UspA family protein
MMKLIWVATDGSECANRAVDTASALAMAVGAQLVIITVVDSRVSGGLDELARVEGGVGEAIELVSSRILVEAKERARKCGATSIDVQSLWGDTAEAIIEKARRDKPDAVVVGRRGRGRGRLAGLLLGSVSQKLVSLAPCTVIVVT